MKNREKKRVERSSKLKAMPMWNAATPVRDSDVSKLTEAKK